MKARVAAAATLLALLGSGTAHGQEHAAMVTIASYAYAPDPLTVETGSTVTWTNHDSAPHTVTSASGPTTLDSPQLEKGQSWSFTATHAGTYRYYCAVHPDMKAQLIVLAPAASATPSRTTIPSPTATATVSTRHGRTSRTRPRTSHQPSMAQASSLPTSSPAATVATASGSPARTLDPDLLLVALTCGAVVTGLLALGRRARGGR